MDIDNAVDEIFVPLLPHFHDKEEVTRAWIRGILTRLIQTERERISGEVETTAVFEGQLSDDERAELLEAIKDTK